MAGRTAYREALAELVEVVGATSAAGWPSVGLALDRARAALLTEGSECGCREKLRDQAQQARARIDSRPEARESLTLFAGLLDGIADSLP